MKMHFVPQQALFELGSACHMQPLEVLPDNWIGNVARSLSITFLMKKCSALVPLQG
jgi:hypothetical protein